MFAGTVGFTVLVSHTPESVHAGNVSPVGTISNSSDSGHMDMHGVTIGCVGARTYLGRTSAPSGSIIQLIPHSVGITPMLALVSAVTIPRLTAQLTSSGISNSQ